jgi:hypothetical protein
MGLAIAAGCRGCAGAFRTGPGEARAQALSRFSAPPTGSSGMADLHTRLRDPGPSWRRGRRGWCRRSRPTREPSPGGPRRSPTRGSAQRAAGQLTQAGPSPPVRPRPAAGRGSLRVGATAVAVRQALKGEAGQEGQADRLATSSNRTAVAGRRCLQRRRARPFLGRARRGRSERGGPSVGSGSVVPRWRSSVSDGPVVAELLDRGGDQPEPGKEPALAQRLAGNKDDRFDANVLPDTLRTDRGRLRILVPDAPPR